MNEELLNKRSDENESQYIWRIGQLVDSGMLPNWKEISYRINQELGRDEDHYYDESAYRKRYQAARRMYEDVFSKMRDDQYIEELEDKIRQLERMKVQFRDERAAWNAQNRIEARIEQKFDLLEKELKSIGKEKYVSGERQNYVDCQDKDMVVMLTDLHIGATSDNTFGEYSIEIAERRINDYCDEVVRIGKRENVDNVYVCLLGDAINGNIHKSIQITNRENVVEQVKVASGLVTDFCFKLAKMFNHVYFASVSGNHSRLDRKEDALHSERLDDLISFYVENMLNSIDNFTYIPNEIDCSIGSIVVRGKEILLVHGDYDSFTQSGLQKLCMMTRKFPYAVLCGHMHTNSFADTSNIKMIRGGSLCGSGDQFCIEKRISGKPSQMCFVMNDLGICGLYPIVFE